MFPSPLMSYLTQNQLRLTHFLCENNLTSTVIEGSVHRVNHNQIANTFEDLSTHQIHLLTGKASVYKVIQFINGRKGGSDTHTFRVIMCSQYKPTHRPQAKPQVLRYTPLWSETKHTTPPFFSILPSYLPFCRFLSKKQPTHK